MQEPLVSVKMITYNHAPYIAQAIECVLAQKTNFPFELVIGEDCSTDSTREIVFDYAKRYPDIIQVITSEKNIGMHKNSLRTTQACQGKYIAYCEGDDYWHHPGKLQKQADYLEANPEYGLVYSDHNWLLTKTNKLVKNVGRSYCPQKTATPHIEDIVTRQIPIRTCTVLAKRDLIEQVQSADPYLHLHEVFKMGDTQLWAELSLITKFHYINESLSTYRIIEESSTQSKDLRKTLQFWISDAEMYLYLCNKHNLPTYIKRMHEKNARKGMLRLSFFAKNFDLAVSARKKYPNFSLKDWAWYWGAKSPCMGSIILLGYKITNGFQKYWFKSNG